MVCEVSHYYGTSWLVERWDLHPHQLLHRERCYSYTTINILKGNKRKESLMLLRAVLGSNQLSLSLNQIFIRCISLLRHLHTYYKYRTEPPAVGLALTWHTCLLLRGALFSILCQWSLSSVLESNQRLCSFAGYRLSTWPTELLSVLKDSNLHQMR